MIIPGRRRIGDRPPARHQRLREFGEEERGLAIGVLAHFACVGGIIAPDAENPADREAIGAPLDRDGGKRRKIEDIGHDTLLTDERHSAQEAKAGALEFDRG